MSARPPDLTMGNEAPELTIAITTRNRADFIGATLDSILPQMSADVELLILDGASSDATPAIVAAYQRRCPALRYVRLETNNGPDRDFSGSVEHSSGRYCWLMTDDDLLRPGAVAAVLHAIAADPSLVIVNAEVRNADLSRIIEPRRLTFAGDLSFAPTDFERLFAETAAYLSFIGAVVIKRSIWLERDREHYFGSLFVHLGVIFQAPLPGTTVVLTEPLISIRYGNAKWRSQQFEVWMFKWPSLVWSFPGISAAAKAAVCVPEPWRDARRLLVCRAKGGYTQNEYRMWLRPRSHSLLDRVRSIGVLWVPGIVANLMALVYCLFSKRGSALRLFDLTTSPFYFPNWLLRRGDC